MDYLSILRAIGAGFTYGLTQWGKKEGQPFDVKKFGVTMVISLVAGLITAFVDMDISGAYEYLMVLGAVPIVENLLKIIKRKVLGMTAKNEEEEEEEDDEDNEEDE